MTTPLISIITPTYNHQHYIGDCIKSVSEQTEIAWEHIIIDDGSTDATWAIIQQHAARDGRILAIRQENIGPARLAETYNTALMQARGEYIAILEGDDRWLPDKLAVQLSSMTPQTVIAYSGYFDDIEGRLSLGKAPPFQGELPLQDFLPIVLTHRSFMLAVTQIIRRNALLEIGGFHQDGSPAAVDMATLVRLITLPGTVQYTARPLGIWRHHTQQSTRLLAIELAMCNAKIALQCYDQLPIRIKQNIHVTRSAIVQSRRMQLADTYFGMLRVQLRSRQYSNLPMVLSGLWRYGGIKRKMQALYGMLAWFGHFDFEPILAKIDRYMEYRYE